MNKLTGVFINIVSIPNRKQHTLLLLGTFEDFQMDIIVDINEAFRTKESFKKPLITYQLRNIIFTKTTK